ncbi:MAG TPA: hypothetical protein VJJ98_06070, partial [Sedimentisphaerales bacterium]|nr:hypothetical protein [Sedimentisphaerales bacterium]
MPTFAYKAIDSAGKEVAATIDAASRIAALDELAENNLCPVVVERQDHAEKGSLAGRVRRVSKSDVEAFTRELANLL